MHSSTADRYLAQAGAPRLHTSRKPMEVNGPAAFPLCMLRTLRVAAVPATLVTGRLAAPYPDGTFTPLDRVSFPGAPVATP